MKSSLILFIVLLLFGSAGAEIKTELVEYKHGEVWLEGYLAYDDAIKGKRPGVVVVHEWWGLNDYIQSRTREVAKLGYIAFAIDMYGKGSRARDPQKAGELSGSMTKDPKLLRSRAAAGLDVLRKQDLTDPRKMAAIGYCFGGKTVLELARSGADLAGVASFHGSLDTQNPDDARNIKGSVLVLHGGDDPFVSNEKVAAFQEEMRKTGVDWQMNIYGNAVHSFTNPDADKLNMKGIKYDEKADRRSWEELKAFLSEIFGR
ncbi:MAG: dienelactone hydrolase family protein [Nitrospirota bacterium]